jgi:hypothetical protein
MAQGLDLPDGYVVEWSAIDATGADVAGVVVGNVSIFGTNLGGDAGTPNQLLGPYMLVPGPGA